MTQFKPMVSGLRVSDTDDAQAYQRIKKTLSLVHLFLTPALLALWVFSGASIFLREKVLEISFNPFFEIGFFFTLFSCVSVLIDLPFSYYSAFVIEHRFNLSNLTFKKWVRETLKRTFLSFAFSLLLIEALYFLIRFKVDSWWLWAWAAYAMVSWVVGKLFPVFIVPLFYKYQPLAEGDLKTRILKLLKRYGLPAAHLFSINLSKTTKKANAAFMGLGKTKRVVLSDTLLEQFSPEEIEQVVAHELGHYKHHDIWKQLGLGLVISFISFGVAFYGMEKMIPALDLKSASDSAGLPLIFLIFLIINYFSMPITNAFSRRCEFAADRFALDACQNQEVFISMMNKLGKVNLADPDPAAWYEFLFYSHPSNKKRIAAAQSWKMK